MASESHKTRDTEGLEGKTWSSLAKFSLTHTGPELISSAQDAFSAVSPISTAETQTAKKGKFPLKETESAKSIISFSGKYKTTEACFQLHLFVPL